jgi:hypothetical protein
MANSKDIDIPRNLLEKITNLLMGLLNEMPLSDETRSQSPRERARKLALEASIKAAGVSGSLAIPPGPVGMLTVLPDLAVVWRIQRQLVADIASCYGKTAELGKEQMLYCLFKHAAGQIVRDVVVRVGERVLIKKASMRVMQRVLRQIGIVVTERVVGRTISRWLPIVGAVGIGAYAFYDTAQVGKTSISLFESQVDTKPDNFQKGEG